ncbi:MAG: hypothetical protein PVI43_06520, partial [Candidatus Bathyarchaeota archaeon]
MKRISILFLILMALLFAVPCFGETYYIGDVGGSQWKYWTTDCPDASNGTNCTANDIQGCCDDLDGSDPANTVIICPYDDNVFSGADIDGNGKLKTQANNLIIKGYPGETIKLLGTGTGEHLFDLDHTGWELHNITLGDTDNTKYAIICTGGAGSFTSYGLTIEGGDHAVYLDNACDWNGYRTTIKDTEDADLFMYINHSDIDVNLYGFEIKSNPGEAQLRNFNSFNIYNGVWSGSSG